MASSLRINREILKKFLPDHESIVKFEKLTSLIDGIAPDVVQQALFQAGAADNKAQEAIDAINRLSTAIELASTSTPQKDNSVTTDYIDFNRNPAHVNRIARMNWNDVDQTVEVGLDWDVTQQVGLEYYARVANETGVTIPNGSVVGFVGISAQDTLSVSPYIADATSNSLYVLGVMTHDLPDSGQVGYCTTWGHVRDINTSAWAVGDILYSSPTTAGALTNVKPTAPNNSIPLATVLVSDATNGAIFVRPLPEQQKYYVECGVFSTLSPAVANTAYPVPIDFTFTNKGFTVSGSQITVQNSGLYKFDITAQITSSSAVAKTLWVWIRRNGFDIPSTARLTTSDINGGYTTLALSEFFSLNANDIIEIYYAADSTAISLSTVAATGFAPQALALTAAITQIQQ